MPVKKSGTSINSFAKAVLPLSCSLVLATSANGATAPVTTPVGIRLAGTDNVKEWCALDAHSSDAKSQVSSIYCAAYIRAVFEGLWVRAARANILDPGANPDPVQCLPAYLDNETIVSLTQKQIAGLSKDGIGILDVEKALVGMFPQCFGKVSTLTSTAK